MDYLTEFDEDYHECEHCYNFYPLDELRIWRCDEEPTPICVHCIAELDAYRAYITEEEPPLNVITI